MCYYLERMEDLLGRFRGIFNSKNQPTPPQLKEPSSINTTEVDESQKLSKKMKRNRTWNNEDVPQDAVKSLLGLENAKFIEEALGRGGTVVEIGAGELQTASELASSFPQGKIIAVEPIPPKGTPQTNLTVVAKKISDIMSSDIPDQTEDVVYSVWTFTYLEDKIAGLNTAWRMLKPGGRAVIHLEPTSTSPAIDQIFERYHLSEYARIGSTSPNSTIKFVTLERPLGGSPDSLDFGDYKFEADHIGDGQYLTRYNFNQPT